MKREKAKFSPAFFVLMFLILIAIIGSYYYYDYINGSYRKNIYEKFETDSKAKTNLVEGFVEGIFEDLETIQKAVFAIDDLDIKSVVKNYGDEVEKKGYKVLGVIDKNNNCYQTDESLPSLMKIDNVESAMNLERTIITRVDENTGEIMAYFLRSVKVDGEFIGAVYVTCGNDYFEARMNELCESDSDLEFIMITDAYGYILWDSKGSFVSGKENNIDGVIYEFSDGNDKISKQIVDDMRKAKSGCGEYENGGKHYISYKLMDNEGYKKNVDWYVVLSFSVEKASAEFERMNSNTYIIIGLFVLIYLIIFLMFTRNYNRSRRNMERLAYVDELTGGMSINKFKDEVVKKNKSLQYERYAIVSLDVDKFKFINDIFGYEEGNEVIRLIWNKLNGIINGEECFARKRADHFVMYMKADDMDLLVARIEMVAKLISSKGKDDVKNYEIGVSAGIYCIEKEDFDVEKAIDRAEMTKRSIKGKHGQICAVYNDDIRQKILKDQEIENRMEEALQNEEFKVFYQPKFDSVNCELVGAEALVRWITGDGKTIYPNEFIPVFENNGFISELDKYMFEHVCRDIRKWIDGNYEVVPVSVNLSQLQLYNTVFIDEYSEILEKYDIPSRLVQLELTETTLFSEVSMLNKIIDRLHGVGFTILMDDFGTGYSSLNMLKDVPVDILKLDKSFVDDIGDEKGDLVVSTIVSLGQSLQMKIVAEGVETKEQFEFLRDIFCDEIQGYYFSKPVPSEEYNEMLIKKYVFEE